MKIILTAVLVAGGLVLADVSGAAAAPTSGATIGNAASLINQIEQATTFRRPNCYNVTRCTGYGPKRRCSTERVCR